MGTSLVILDAPLLFEFKLDKICALSIVVAAAPETQQLKRVMNSDAIDEEAAKKRIDAQMPLALKLDRCDVALQNDTSKIALHALLEAASSPPTKERGGGTSCPFPDSSFVVVLACAECLLARRDRLFGGRKKLRG